MTVSIGSVSPNLKISKWVQGKPTNIDAEKGNVVLVEVFQVNCPGCFLYGIPEAIQLHNKFKDRGLKVLGIATAFEDYDKNTIENLEKLVTSGHVVGETFKALEQYGQLGEGGKLPYSIPFPVAMDKLVDESGPISNSKVMDFVEANVPDFRSMSAKERDLMVERVTGYLKNKKYSALTFEEFNLRGTPSAIIIDRKGILRHVSFGANGSLDHTIQRLIDE